MAGYYCDWCVELDQKCDLSLHLCLCGANGLVWMDGWVECEKCARQRIKEERLKENRN